MAKSPQAAPAACGGENRHLQSSSGVTKNLESLAAWARLSLVLIADRFERIEETW